jgi:hypothetical protein
MYPIDAQKQIPQTFLVFFLFLLLSEISQTFGHRLEIIALRRNSMILTPRRKDAQRKIKKT